MLTARDSVMDAGWSDAGADDHITKTFQVIERNPTAQACGYPKHRGRQFGNPWQFKNSCYKHLYTKDVRLMLIVEKFVSRTIQSSPYYYELVLNCEQTLVLSYEPSVFEAVASLPWER